MAARRVAESRPVFGFHHHIRRRNDSGGTHPVTDGTRDMRHRLPPVAKGKDLGIDAGLGRDFKHDPIPHVFAEMGDGIHAGQVRMGDRMKPDGTPAGLQRLQIIRIAVPSVPTIWEPLWSKRDGRIHAYPT